VLDADVVGRLERPLTQAAGGSSALARAIGDGVLDAGDRLDRIYIGPGDLWNQPAATACTPSSARATSRWRRFCA
jgi:hypothetical protein